MECWPKAPDSGENNQGRAAVTRSNYSEPDYCEAVVIRQLLSGSYCEVAIVAAIVLEPSLGRPLSCNQTDD